MKENKIVVVTNLKNGATSETSISLLGEVVYKITRDVQAVNNAIRWANTHSIGDSNRYEAFLLELKEDWKVK